jgi:L-fucose mutarotase
MGLLKGIDPLLTADLLHVLRSMGHGDKLCVCDCNFPAASVAAETPNRSKVIVLTVPLPEAVSAICSVLPLDFFVESPVQHMAPSEGLTLPPEGHEVIEATKAAVASHAGSDVGVAPLSRFVFYEEAKTCYAIVQTMERRPYGNFILHKGVIGPDGKDLKPTS